MRIDATKDFRRSRAEVLTRFRSPERVESVLQGMNIATTLTAGAPEPVWDCTMQWRDAPRRFTTRLAEPSPGETMAMTIASDLADVAIDMEFYDLPDGGCRVISKADVTAHSMLVRLALQSLRLIRGKAEARLTRLLTALGRP